jgi:hypothetical protein
MSNAHLTAEQLEQFGATGLVIVPHLVTPARVSELRDVAQAHLAMNTGPAEYEPICTTLAHRLCARLRAGQPSADCYRLTRDIRCFGTARRRPHWSGRCGSFSDPR